MSVTLQAWVLKQQGNFKATLSLNAIWKVVNIFISDKHESLWGLSDVENHREKR